MTSRRADEQPPAAEGSAPVDATAPDRGLTRRRLFWIVAVAAVAGVALAVATVARYGANANAVAWAAAQLVLVFVAAYDVATRKILNVVVVPAGAIVILLRVAFERGSLAESLIAGAAAFLVFLVLAVLTGGGFGMGDVKLVGLLGLLLGREVLPALLIGAVAGGVASIAVIASRRGSRRTAIAYGPYLCLGGSIAILALHPPPLV
jgi:leader peptidase (prepilin peptidase)/N-methyltransferase